MDKKTFLEKLQALVTGSLSEDEIVSILTELEENFDGDQKVKSSKVADFFNREDKSLDDEAKGEEETHEEDAVEDDEVHIDDLFEDEEEDKEDLKDEEDAE